MADRFYPRIHLVRHGLSEANLDKSINIRVPDHAIELAPEGHDQAHHAGQALATVLSSQHPCLPRGAPLRVRMLVSPYRRTRQTADGLLIGLEAAGFMRTNHRLDRREHIALREQSFGLFDGIEDDQIADLFPAEHAQYAKALAFEGQYFAPIPMGEARVQVADRVQKVFGTITRDAQGDDPITDVVVVSHGVTIRMFRHTWLHYPWEWTETEPNPRNCSIRTLSRAPGAGWTDLNSFPGFARIGHNEQERREADGIAPEATA